MIPPNTCTGDGAPLPERVTAALRIDSALYGPRYVPLCLACAVRALEDEVFVGKLEFAAGINMTLADADAYFVKATGAGVPVTPAERDRAIRALRGKGATS